MGARDIVEQIRSLTRFFRSQGSLLDRDLATRSEAALVTSIAQQISSLRSLDVAGAASINDAISSSTMSLPLKAQLAAAATRRALVAQTVTTHRRTCQTLHNPCAFFTEGDWQCFEDATIGVGRKVMIMADRMHRLGLTTPSEMTTKHLTAMIAATHSPDASPASLHSLVQEVKSAFRGQVTTLPHESISPTIHPPCLLW